MKVCVDPLLAETVPDGTFGGARPRRAAPRKPRRFPDPDAARHLAEALREVNAYHAARRARGNTPGASTTEE